MSERFLRALLRLYPAAVRRYGVSGLILGVILLTSYFPARRIARVDPARVLESE